MTIQGFQVVGAKLAFQNFLCLFQLLTPFRILAKKYVIPRNSRSNASDGQRHALCIAIELFYSAIDDGCEWNISYCEFVLIVCPQKRVEQKAGGFRFFPGLQLGILGSNAKGQAEHSADEQNSGESRDR